MVIAVGVGAVSGAAAQDLASREVESHQAARPRSCERVELEVSLTPEDADTHLVRGTLCTRGPSAGRTVQVLLAGATYAKAYWDFPASSRYSYVDAQLQAGFVTLSLDRIGTGESDRPPANRVTTQANAHVVHQVVEALRAGSVGAAGVGRSPAARIVLVGHSLGAAVAALEAATYRDVDGVILSGVLHGQGPKALELAEQLHPAAHDPAFADASAPEGYLTTLPGSRGGLFYHPETSDPAVIAADESTKSTVTAGELSDLAQAASATASLGVPALVVVGDEDFIYCEPPSCARSGALERERAFYAPDARLTVVALAGAAHAINLHRQAPSWYAMAAVWTATQIGPDRAPQERGR